MFKNVASQKIALFAYDSTTGAPKTGDGANITPYVSKDYGTVTVLGTTTATEMDATNAKGWYSFVLTQAETNADALLFSGKSSTSNAYIVGFLVYTDPASFTSFVTPTNLTAAQIATGVWTDTTAGDFTTALSVGKSVMNGVALGTGLKVDQLTTNNDKTGYTVSTVSDKTGYALTSAYDPAKTASQAGDAMALTSGERNSTADALLNRDMSTGSDSGSTTVRTVRQALRFLRNKWAISAGTLTVYKEDDSTSSWTSTVSTDGTAQPIVGTDPAGP